MVRMLLGVLLAAGPVVGQDVEKKDAPKPPPKQEGAGPMLSVAEVDVNGDGWISAAELKAALAKLGGGPKEGGRKEGGKPKPGEGDKPAPKPEGGKEGDGRKPPAPKPEGGKEGGERKGDEKKGEAPKERRDGDK